MDGRQKPDPQPENENELNDEQAIDLTQIVQGGDNVDIIDLTEILEEPEQELDDTVEPEEATIPLVDIIPSGTSTDLSVDVDDEIIDLTAVAEAPETSAVKPAAEFAPTPDEDDGDEEVIDLMDVATTLETDLTETEMKVPADISEETTGNTEADEPIIDLLDAVEPPPEEAETAVDTDDELTDLETRAQAILTGATDAFDYETPEEAAETSGPDSDVMVFEDDGTISDKRETPAIVDDEPKIPEPAADGILFVPASPSEPLHLTDAQVEGALERIVEKIYGEKIEQLMIRAIEKTVTKEIARIKNALLEDDDDMVG